MPTYEYSCKKCGQTFETIQSFSDKPLRKHKECGGELQKVFHARGVVFKGSGFYSTDSRARKSETSNGAAKKTESKTKAAATPSTLSDSD
jgi:putative FmdB family regulatory protein